MTAEEILSQLRGEGWKVAVHNDYCIKEEAYTLWLLTHTCGRYVKGEGRTDVIALGECLRQIQRFFLTNHPPYPFGTTFVGHRLELNFNNADDALRFWRWVGKAINLGLDYKEDEEHV